MEEFSEYNANIEQPASEAGGSYMAINALLQKPEWEQNLYNNNNKKFEMCQIQCDCCQCGEHQIGKQVCQIRAQFHHIQAYKEKHPQEYKQNATRYETMNRPKVIKTVCTNNQIISSIDEFQDKSEDRYLLILEDYANKE